jgi:site-specific recombinase XerD
MATDFALFLRRFLTAHLAGLRGYSPNTIASYRDAFKLLICYFRDERSIPPERLTLELIDAAAITGFLHWLRTSRHNSASTSGWPRSTRSSPGCNPRTRPAWRAARTSSRSPPGSTTARPWPT